VIRKLVVTKDTKDMKGQRNEGTTTPNSLHFVHLSLLDADVFLSALPTNRMNLLSGLHEAKSSGYYNKCISVELYSGNPR
jgi:hypothetical protein